MEPSLFASPLIAHEDDMKLFRIALAISALGLFAGCVAVPAYPEYAAAPAPYYGPAYYPPPGYYGPAYYPPPVYYGPSVGIGVFGAWRGGHRHGWHGRHG